MLSYESQNAEGFKCLHPNHSYQLGSKSLSVPQIKIRPRLVTILSGWVLAEISKCKFDKGSTHQSRSILGPGGPVRSALHQAQKNFQISAPHRNGTNKAVRRSLHLTMNLGL